MRALKFAILIAASLTASGCLGSYGFGHGLVAVGTTLTSEVVLDSPWPGAIAAGAFYFGKEWEETRGWKRFQFGVADAVLDVCTPIAVGALLSWALDKW